MKRPEKFDPWWSSWFTWILLAALFMGCATAHFAGKMYEEKTVEIEIIS